MNYSLEIEKLKYAVINMHLSALFLCAVCWPVIFWSEENIFNLGLPVFFVTGGLSVYNFVRQTIFLSRHPSYQKSKKAFLCDTIAYSCCIVLAPITGVVELFNNFKSWQIVVFLSLKMYYVLFVGVTMVMLMGAAHRLNKIWVKAAKGEDHEPEREGRSVSVYSLWGTWMVGIGSIAILFVGLGNILYYLLCLPAFIVSAILFAIYFIRGAGRETKVWKTVIALLCIGTLVTISHIFTHASTVVDYDKIRLDFEIYTLVIVLDVVLMIASFVLFYRKDTT